MGLKEFGEVSVLVNKNQPLEVGRFDNSLEIPEEHQRLDIYDRRQMEGPTISRNHFIIFFNQEESIWAVVDTESANGTMVGDINLEANKPQRLTEGTTINFSAQDQPISFEIQQIVEDRFLILKPISHDPQVTFKLRK